MGEDSQFALFCQSPRPNNPPLAPKEEKLFLIFAL